MGTWIWAIVLVVALWAAHWGAEQVTEPLKKLRRHRGKEHGLQLWEVLLLDGIYLLYLVIMLVWVLNVL